MESFIQSFGAELLSFSWSEELGLLTVDMLLSMAVGESLRNLVSAVSVNSNVPYNSVVSQGLNALLKNYFEQGI
jgi:hypothetical protein